MTPFGSKKPHWPLATKPGAELWPVQSGHGAQVDGARRRGVFLAAEEGTPVLAVDDGVVVAVSKSLGGETVGLWIDHNDAAYTALYQGLRHALPVGMTVSSGGKISEVGGAGGIEWQAWQLGTRPPRPLWKPDAQMPAGLLDPSSYLTLAAKNDSWGSSGGGGVVIAGLVVGGLVIGGAWWALRKKKR